MLNEGKVLAERYEITGKIGTGGMSDVYKAKDHKLNRFVAIKVLKSEFSENKSFVSKFRVEAQSAAILMHPNIVNVYDVGDEEGLYYIVMELVEGITLKKYIEKKIRLSFKETISIAIQVSSGIEAAHNNHIIHRDIKPQNIIISKDGKVKVTDFGIARAATSNTITSNAMGSVHYTSPEQARGGYSDEKSDIYSLGITMFEMLTGVVPFDGESTVAIAIKHIQEELPSLEKYVEDVPVSVEKIIDKCCKKNAAKRYQSMTELIVDLKKSLISPDEDFVEQVETQGAKTRMLSQEDVVNIRRQTGQINIPEEELSWNYERPRKKRRAEDSLDEYYEKKQDYLQEDYYPEEPQYSDEEYYEEEKYSDENYQDERYEDSRYADDRYQGDRYSDDEYYEDEYYQDEYYEDEIPVRKSSQNRSSRSQSGRGDSPKKSSAKKSSASRKSSSSDSRRAPSKNNAKKVNKANSRDVNRRRRDRFEEFEEDEDDDDLDPRTQKIMSVLSVIAALIIAGIAIYIVARMFGVFKSTTGTLSGNNAVSESVTMVSVTGMKFDDAKTELRSMGLEVQATYVSSSTVEKDQVIDQSIAEGETVASGTVVELSVSSGTDGISIPNVTGISEAEARVKLEDSGFIMEKDESASDSVEKGNVISQNPAAGENAPAGATVTIVISTGKSTNQVTVPDVRLQTEDDARAMLQAAGLQVSEVTEESSPTVPVGCIISQSYSPNVSVPEGTSVALVKCAGNESATGLYRCNFSVNAPSGYSGGNASVLLTQAETGTVLFSTITTGFPVVINLENITGSDTATLSITYLLTNTVIHENEDGSIDSQVTNEEKTETQQVTLTPQQ